MARPVHHARAVSWSGHSSIPVLLRDGVDAETQPSFESLGRYRILRRLGTGANGVVFAARDQELGRDVALKLLRAAHPDAIASFKHEFRALADLPHPNLVTLHELCKLESRWFLTMELIEGVDFLAHVREEPDRLRPALRQLARGLFALHGAGKLHRDVKPSNVLVDRTGRVVVLDLGLVASLGAPSPESGEYIVGTVRYMSPEQILDGAALSPASDWYSVGVILYEALTGRAPFEGPPLEIIAAKQERDPVPPRELAPDAPPELAALAMDLLRHRPDDRPAGIDVLLRLGEAVGTGQRPRWRAPAPSSAPFIGRRDALEQLDAACAAVAAGAPAAVRIAGPSGIGKTALVQRFLRRFHPGDAVVAHGRCYEREAVPYKGFDSVVDAISEHLRAQPAGAVAELVPRSAYRIGQLFPQLAWLGASGRRAATEPDPQMRRGRAFASLRRLLARLARRVPVVIAIDDLQWVGADTAELTADLLRPPHPPPVLWLLAFRAGESEISPTLCRLLRRLDAEAVGVRDLEVSALPSADARDLAAALLVDRAAAGAIGTESGGNPYFVGELARYANEVDAAQPATLGTVIATRVERLPAPARALLEVVCVAGQPVPRTAALRAASVRADDAALHVLRAGHLVRTRGDDAIEAYHDRIRETVVAGLARPRLDDCHRELAHALLQAGHTDPEALATHFLGAGDVATARRYTIAAAEQAARALAFDRAANLYRRAIDLVPSARGECLPELGDALASAGRAVESAEAYGDAAALTTGTDALELRRRAADQLLRSGRLTDGIAAFRSILAETGVRTAGSPRRALASGLCRRAWLRVRGLRPREPAPSGYDALDLVRIDTLYSVSSGLSMVTPIRAMHFGAQQLTHALRVGEPYRYARALTTHIVPLAVCGGRFIDRVDALLDRARDACARTEHPHAHALLGLVSGIVAFYRGHWREAAIDFGRAEARLRECPGASWELSTCQFYRLLATQRLGNYAAMAERAPELVLAAHQRNNLHAATNLRMVHAYVRLAGDDVGAAREDIDEALARWPDSGLDMRTYRVTYMRAVVDSYIGDADGVLAQLAAAVPALRRGVFWRIQEIRLQTRYLRGSAAAAVGARRRARSDARAIEASGMAWARPLARVIRARLARSAGDAARCERELRTAAGEFDDADMCAHAAAARRLAGDVAAADAVLRRCGVAVPKRMCNLLAPAFIGA